MVTARSFRRVLLLALGSFTLVVTACGDDDDATVAIPPAEDGASDGESDAGADDENASEGEASASTGSVFPAQIADTLDIEETADIPDGGRAAVGLVCNGGGGDLLYAGVVDATGAQSGTYEATADSAEVTFATGAPTAGMGAGATQGTFDEAEHTFDFGDVGVEITVGGCGS